jgi:hypothetical protein
VKLIGTAAIALTLALSAQSPAVAADKKNNEEVGDPNRMICRTQKSTGSRLKAGKICMTAQQWADAKKENREALEGAQQRRPTNF